MPNSFKAWLIVSVFQFVGILFLGLTINTTSWVWIIFGILAGCALAVPYVFAVNYLEEKFNEEENQANEN